MHACGAPRPLHSFPTRRSSDLVPVVRLVGQARDGVAVAIHQELNGGQMEMGGGRLQRRRARSEEHTSELQSRGHLVCRLLPEKKKHIRTALRWCACSTSR